MMFFFLFRYALKISPSSETFYKEFTFKYKTDSRNDHITALSASLKVLTYPPVSYKLKWRRYKQISQIFSRLLEKPSSGDLAIENIHQKSKNTARGHL